MNSAGKLPRWLALSAMLAVTQSGCLNGGETKADDPGSLPGPNVSLSASPDTVAAGQMSSLTWSAANATSCSASGAWTGSRPVSGTEDVGPLSGDSQFTLTCSGDGGTAEATVIVTVTGSGGAPILTFSASPSVVNAGTAATLRWSALNVDSCSASGSWNGARPTSGSESTGPLSANASYTLTCNGSGGSVSESVNVAIATNGGPGIVGAVDSSLLDRYGENRVYLFAGMTTPDDFDGDGGDALATAVVQQDAGACTFGYDFGALSAGDYTIAFTADAAADDPQTDDGIVFFGTRTVTVGASMLVEDFNATNILRVGPGRTFQTVAAAAGAAQDGDVVEIDAGLYPADVASWFQDNLTLRGVGGYAHLRADGADAQGKAIWVIAGNNTIVENIEFSQITVPDQNGAGIRAEGRNLVICNGYFHDSDEGILGGVGDVLIEYSEFDNNGFGDGQSHNMYILEATDRFILRHSYVHHARIGHNVKTRARENYVLYNRIMDEASGNSSYAIDIPNGGLSFVIGNTMQQGPNTDNSSMVNYGTEGLLGGRTHNLYLVNNTLVDDYGGRFVQAANATSLVRLVNNLFVGGGTILSGPAGSMTTNLQTTAPALVDIDGFNYRLTGASPARDSGSDPGIGNGVDLRPEFEYVHVKDRRLRPSDAQIDIGAFEFEP